MTDPTDASAPDGALARLPGDLFLAVQGLALVVLGAIAGALIAAGDPKDAALIGTGIIGALTLNHKQLGGAP